MNEVETMTVLKRPAGGGVVDSHYSRGSGRPGNSNNNSNNTRTNSSNSNSDRHRYEQGVIHTLLDKFGFIHCADRPVELFFHHTSLTNHNHNNNNGSRTLRWEELNIGDEVEFRVGRSHRRGEEDKPRAEHVRLLPPGTVVWETEDIVGKLYRGVVRTAPREGGRDRENKRGAVRYDDDRGEATFATGDGPNDVRLGRGDVVEFNLFTERRTGQKLARNIALIRSERERVRLEREKELLEKAVLETGVVVADRGEFGFIKSVRRGEVYYHNDHVEKDHDDDPSSVSLKIRQEVEFYVIDVNSLNDPSQQQQQRNSNGSQSSGRKNLEAREIKLLPEGTVKFEHVLAEGATGVVVECPIEPGTEGFGRSSSGGGGGKKKQVMGKIRLDVPVKSGEGDGDITEVLLHFESYPGGTYAMNRVGSEMVSVYIMLCLNSSTLLSQWSRCSCYMPTKGSWIRPGDTILFDVVQTISDGKCKAVPTKYEHIASLRPEGWTPDESTKPAVRLVELALMGRTEGIIRSIHSDYAFITCAERNVDAYMKLHEVFPNELHSVLVKNNPELCTDETNHVQDGGRAHLEVGMEVSFDLSMQILTNHSGGMGGGRNGGRNTRGSQEKESLRARRVQILPKGTIKSKYAVATGVRATVIKSNDRRQGTIELDESITIQKRDTIQRFPYIAKLLDYVSTGKYGDEVVYNDILMPKDAQAVTVLVDNRDDLQWRYIPLDGENVKDPHHRKLLCIKKRDEENVTCAESAAVSVDDKENEAEEVAGPSSANSKTDEPPKTEEASAKETPSEVSNTKGKGKRVIKNLHFGGVSNLDPNIGSLLSVGDIITCDIYLYRGSGLYEFENIVVVERKEQPDKENNKADNKKNLTGYVTEVVSSRQFGFITGIDDNGSKTGDHVFFHFKSVNSADETPLDANPAKPKIIKSDIIRKGDEVRFDVGPGKNGKLTATAISILPRGTLKLPASKVDKSALCTGYVLLEPSHTSLANTPSHMVARTGPSLDGAGRWDNVGKEPKASNVSGSNIKEEGVILLLSDPSNLFSARKDQSDRKSSVDGSEAKENNENDASDDKHESEVDINVLESVVGTHVRYKPSSLAYRFSLDNPDRPDGPRRGDLVVFSKTKGAKLLKDMRIEKLEAATTVNGVLVDIKINDNSATFVSSDETKYNILLSELVSCDKTIIQENQEVNSVLHEGKIYGGE